MKVSVKVGLVLSIVVAASLAGLTLGLHAVLNERFSALESREVNLNGERLEEILSELMKGPSLKIKDWANWDDTVKYINDRNKAYEESNLIPATLDNVNIDSLRIFDKNFDPIFKLDRVNSTELDLWIQTEKANLFKDPLRMQALKGFVNVGEKLAIYAVLPVRPGTGEGEPVGQMLMLKFVEKVFLDHVSEIFKVPVTFEKAVNNFGDSKSTGNGVEGVVKHPEGVLTTNTKFTSENEVRIFTIVKGLQNEGLATFQATLERPIYAEAKTTTKTAIVACALAFITALIALIFSLRIIVVGRLVRLTREVKKVGQVKVDGGRVCVQGSDEIASLAASMNGLLANLEERKAAVSKIVQNVSTGFALVSCDGTIEDGYTKHLEKLLQKRDLFGQKISSLLFPSERDQQSFELLYNQLVDDVLPEEINIDQIPRQCLLGDMWLSINCAVIRNSQGKLEKTLVTLNDISDQKRAEQANADTLATLKILQCKSVFKEFIEEIPQVIQKLKSNVSLGLNSNSAIAGSDTRRSLHTIKGNFAMFGLSKLARSIHLLEEKSCITLDDVEQIERMTIDFLAERFDLLEIKYGQQVSEKMSISEAEVQDFMSTAKSWKSLGHAQQELQHFFQRMHCAPAHEALLPVVEAGLILTKKMAKKADFSVIGGGHRIDQKRLRPILDALINAIRNAVDHGIEMPHDRGAKNEVATVVIGVYLAQDRIYFYVEDDGQGVSWDALKEVVVKKGLSTNSAFEQMSEAARMEFLFADSVSTVETATDISGRGLGMGGLRDAARSLGGDLSVFSQKGKGTRVELWVPEKPKTLRNVG